MNHTKLLQRLQKPSRYHILAYVLFWLFLLGQAVWAEIYVEGYAGYVKTATVFRDYLAMTTHHPSAGTTEEHRTRGTFLPAVLGGVKVGTWFGPEGFLGADYPPWLRHFGAYLDFSYHRQNFRYRVGPSIQNWGVATGRNSFESNGNAITLALMVAGRLGFLANDQVPFGRLQPYFAVGPALLISDQRVTLRSSSLVGGVPIPYSLSPGSETAVVPALVVEPGVRWHFNKHVSLDLSFKFRWAHPSFTFTYDDPLGPGRETFTLHPQYLILSFQLGAAYHF